MRKLIATLALLTLPLSGAWGAKLGKTSGASTSTLQTARAITCRVVVGASAFNATSLKVFLINPGASAIHAAGAIYAGPTTPGARLATTTAGTLNASTSTWVSMPITYTLTANATYFLAVQVDADCDFRFDIVGSLPDGFYVDTVLTYPTFADPFVSVYNDNTGMAFYADDTASGGGTATPAQPSVILMFSRLDKYMRSKWSSV